jgi:FemAB-related protein (PEP-CTERM system-associated)
VTVSGIDEPEWEPYVLAHPEATVDHSWAWRSIFEEVFGHRTAYLAARRDGAVVGVLPLVLFQSRLFGRAVISLPFLNYGGLLADDESAAAALSAEATQIGRQFKAAHVELRHQRAQLAPAPCRQHKLRLTRALAATVDGLWADTDRKVRNQVRKAQKENLTAVSGGVELLGEFYDVFARNMRDLGTPVYPRGLFTETLRVFGSAARVHVVRGGGRAMAAAVALTFRDTVLVPWASSLREFRPLCPNMLLYWSMLEEATVNGLRVFDFGRSSPNGGTHQFKLQWGASEAPLYWEYPYLAGGAIPDHGPTNPKFQRAIAVWRHCPLWLTNAVGPHVVRAIP